jgi:hypothetical protein
MEFFLFGFYAMSSAEAYSRSAKRFGSAISFGVHSERAWNHWDYLAAGSFVIFVALLVVTLMFLHKDD